VNREIRFLQFRSRHPTYFLLSTEPVIRGAATPRAVTLANVVCPATDCIFDCIDLFQQTKGRIVAFTQPTNRNRCHDIPQFLLQFQDTCFELPPAIPAKL
jgi:hypothetical protein